MEWRIVKMGTDLFDLLHAYGAGILLAYATNAPIAIKDEGCSYQISSQGQSILHTSIALLDDVFSLPEPEHVLNIQQPQVGTRLTTPLAVANLDGLLAALYTSPRGVRVCSVPMLLRKQRLEPSSVQRAIASVHDKCERWKGRILRETQHASQWLDELGEDYDALHPRCPLPETTNPDTDITVTMTLDPALGYASRQPHSDGRIAHKVNMTIRGTRFAPLLAYIGAMRFLRAQPVAGNLVVYAVPVTSLLTVHRESIRPFLWPRDDNAPEEALALQWLSLAMERTPDEVQWSGLSYQILQAQGKQQAIARSRGFLDLTWFASLKDGLRKPLLWHWKRLLRLPAKERPYDLHALVDALVAVRRQYWEAHVADVAQAQLARQLRKPAKGQEKPLRLYQVDEVREVAAAMESSPSTPLSIILEQKEGTIRFGHALRQLRSNAASVSHDLFDDLASVQTREQLINILARTIEVCAVMDARTYFLITPSDQDLKLLLEDVERHGAPTIAGLLRLLSTLRYPARTDEPRPFQLRNWLLWKFTVALLGMLPATSDASDLDTTDVRERPTQIVSSGVAQEGEDHDTPSNAHNL